MKIKAAFVLLALVAFVGLLQSADAFGGAQNVQEARIKCRRDCKRMHSNPDRCLRFCNNRRLTGQDYEEDYDDDANDVDDEDYVEDGLDLVERRLRSVQAVCRDTCKYSSHKATCINACVNGHAQNGYTRRLRSPRRLSYGGMKCRDCDKFFAYCDTAKCRSEKRRCKAQVC